MAISKLVFDTKMIAKALHIDEDEVVKAFSDGRGAWPFSELWGQSLYEFIKHANTNQPFSDGQFAIGQIGSAQISVKALTANGVKFQQSKDVGVGRKSTKQKLVSSLEACDRVVVVDLTEFPVVRFIPIESTRLISAAHSDRLRVGGWKKNALEAWLEEVYEVSEITLQI
ncbi:MAG: hypothetical protein B7Z04_08905 [Rhodobacterales bacterium 32-66-9]|nr:MAG: hypothetical protein B7Z04_08905 [Rhodobacterales bacterium 32-66-9]